MWCIRPSWYAWPTASSSERETIVGLLERIEIRRPEALLQTAREALGFLVLGQYGEARIRTRALHLDKGTASTQIFDDFVTIVAEIADFALPCPTPAAAAMAEQRRTNGAELRETRERLAALQALLAILGSLRNTTFLIWLVPVQAEAAATGDALRGENEALRAERDALRRQALASIPPS